MKEDKKADRAVWKEERSGRRDGVERDSFAGVQQGKCRQRLGQKKPTGEEG